MYIKILGSICLIGGMWAIGFEKAQVLRSRVEKLQEFKRMLLLLQGEFRFHRATLSEALEKVSEKVSDSFQKFLGETAERLENRESKEFEELWMDASREFIKAGGFAQRDESLLAILGRGLGCLDMNAQMDIIRLALEQTEDAIAEAKEQSKIQGKLYCTMGVTGGAFLVLLMI